MKETGVILTGSHAYGTPTGKSDVDLVVLIPRWAARILLKLGESGGGSGGPEDMSVVFGKLNLIVVSEPKEFEVWQRGTAELIFRKPVTRDEAVDHFARLRRESE